MSPLTISKTLTKKEVGLKGAVSAMPYSQSSGPGLTCKFRIHATNLMAQGRETMNLRGNNRTEPLKVRTVRLLMHKYFAVTLGLMLLAFVTLIVACNSKPAAPAPAENKPAPQSASAVALSATKERGMSFPDFGFMVKPAEYIQNYSDQPIFRLKADFPKEKPEHVPEFVEKIDFKKNPKEYLLAARDYALKAICRIGTRTRTMSAAGTTFRGCIPPPPALKPIHPTAGLKAFMDSLKKRPSHPSS